MKHLIGKVQTKEVDFMEDKVTIRKLSIDSVMKLRDIIKNAKEESEQMDVLRSVLRMAVVDAEDMTDEQFNTFPPQELNFLSEQILAYCGLSDGAGAEVGNSPAKKK